MNSLSEAQIKSMSPYATPIQMTDLFTTVTKTMLHDNIMRPKYRKVLFFLHFMLGKDIQLTFDVNRKIYLCAIALLCFLISNLSFFIVSRYVSRCCTAILFQSNLSLNSATFDI